MAKYNSLFVLKVPLNVNQRTNRSVYSHCGFAIHGFIFRSLLRFPF